MWHIDFSKMPDGPLNPNDWTFDTLDGSDENGEQIPARGYNDENVAYTSDSRNVRIENGRLVVEARKQKLHGADYTSARLTTKGIHDETSGTLTVRAKLPRGKGAWPAIWMLPTDGVFGEKYDGQSDFDWYERYMENGEIDLMEATAVNRGVIEATTHTYDSILEGSGNIGKVRLGDSMYEEFHDYSVTWDEQKLVVSVDGKPCYEQVKQGDSRNYPFTSNQPMYLILNVAVGGEMGGPVNPEDFTDGQRMEVASIQYEPSGV